ncbi:phosphatase PAP2 family protein [Oryzicola mucosus]|uniref:Phosphatase PAP2 family protein n=1 Tax=Oryzicola mucosus TaxID=2767425 RepID=A0A8J6U7J8_9HYPH|nr:phosphatase PAP2 family protein [Oryzicola mucosus]MBD0414897.1 phosphatase PAP2 family protein [Oryzicola mucosus]
MFQSLRNRIQLSLLIAGLIIAGGLWGFVELSEVARDSDPHAFDMRILLAFRTAGDPSDPIGPSWFEEAVRDITALGGAVVLIYFTAIVIIYLLLVRRWGLAVFAFVSIAGGQLLSSLLKLGIDRPRPELVSHLSQVHTMSFPSGHAMLSAVTYLTLGALLSRAMPNRAATLYVFCVAILTTLMVGMSRLYLGVHWPSDVLAGWCAGFAWATLCWLASQWLGRQDTAPDNI